MKKEKERHFQAECAFAQRILASEKNSPERERLFREAYDEIARLIAVYAPGGGETRYTHVVADIVARRIPPGGEVFDLGCATGNLLFELARRGFRVSGIDVSGDLIQQAKEKLGEVALADQVSQADVMGYSPSALVDCVVMDNSIEHLHPDSVGDVLRKCRAMLKPGGYLLVLTPHRFSGPHDITRDFLPLGSKAQGLHLREYSFTELDDELRCAGFSAVMGFPFHPRLLRKLRWIPDCSNWAARKAMALERAFSRSRILFRLLTSSAVGGHLGVALLFPSICMARK